MSSKYKFYECIDDFFDLLTNCNNEDICYRNQVSNVYGIVNHKYMGSIDKYIAELKHLDYNDYKNSLKESIDCIKNKIKIHIENIGNEIELKYIIKYKDIHDNIGIIDYYLKHFSGLKTTISLINILFVNLFNEISITLENEPNKYEISDYCFRWWRNIIFIKHSLKLNNTLCNNIDVLRKTLLSYNYLDLIGNNSIRDFFFFIEENNRCINSDIDHYIFKIYSSIDSYIVSINTLDSILKDNICMTYLDNSYINYITSYYTFVDTNIKQFLTEKDKLLEMSNILIIETFIHNTIFSWNLYTK